MTVPNRPNKTGGGTDVVDGNPVLAAEWNGDINPLYLILDNGIAADNIAAGAVGTSELAAGAVTDTEVAASADIGTTKVNDFSNTDAEQATDADPGVTGAQTNATDLSEEIQHLRYAIRRLATGINAEVEVDGTSAIWSDLPARGRDHIINGSFLNMAAAFTGTASPDTNWVLVSTPSTVAAEALPVTEGYGNGLQIVCDAASEGIQQTVTGLKAETRYLVEIRVKPTTGTVNLVTTGADATSDFDDLALTSATGSGVYETISGIVQTDAVPTDIVVQITGSANLDDFTLSNVSMLGMSADASARGGSVCLTAASTATTVSGGGSLEEDTTVYVTVPGPNYALEVQGFISMETGSTNRNVMQITLDEDVDADGFATSYFHANTNNVNFAGENSDASIFFTRGPGDLTPGSTYGYRLSTTGPTYLDATLDDPNERPHRIAVKLVDLGAQ